MRIKRALNATHDIDSVQSEFLLQGLFLAQSDAVFTL